MSKFKFIGYGAVKGNEKNERILIWGYDNKDYIESHKKYDKEKIPKEFNRLEFLYKECALATSDPTAVVEFDFEKLPKETQDRIIKEIKRERIQEQKSIKKREKLRKVKWIINTKCFLGEKEIFYSEIEDLDQESQKLIERVAVYEEGYFHKWIIEYFGDLHEGINTYEYALIEKRNGEIIYEKSDEIIFIDEFKDTTFHQLRKLIGQAIQKDNFTDVLELIKILSTNELIQNHINDIAQGFKDGALEKVLTILEELLDAGTNKERLKDVADKYEL